MYSPVLLPWVASSLLQAGSTAKDYVKRLNTLAINNQILFAPGRQKPNCHMFLSEAGNLPVKDKLPGDAVHDAMLARAVTNQKPASALGMLYLILVVNAWLHISRTGLEFASRTR